MSRLKKLTAEKDLLQNSNSLIKYLFSNLGCLIRNPDLFFMRNLRPKKNIINKQQQLK